MPSTDLRPPSQYRHGWGITPWRTTGAWEGTDPLPPNPSAAGGPCAPPTQKERHAGSSRASAQD
eukprot:7177380-Pyramimonas_sp.AAC.1